MSMHKNVGFTLIELIMVLAVTASILIIAIIMGKGVIDKHRSNTAIDELASAVSVARQEAVSRGSPVTLCGSADEASCDGQWSEGQMVFVDHNGDRQHSEDEQVIRHYPPTLKNGTVSWRAFGNSKAITFLPTGYTDNQNGTFIYCNADKNPVKARGLIVAKSGRFRLTMTDAELGVHLDGYEKPLHCT